MSTLQEAKQAFFTFNHSHYKGKTLTIRWATPKVSQGNQRCPSSLRSSSHNQDHTDCETGHVPNLEDSADGTLSLSPPSQLQDHHGNPNCFVPEHGSLSHSGKSPLAKLKACLEQLPLSVNTPPRSPSQLRELPAPTTPLEGLLTVPADFDEELDSETSNFADHSNSSDTSSVLEDDPVITREGGSTVLQQCCISEVCANQRIQNCTSCAKCELACPCKPETSCVTE